MRIAGRGSIEHKCAVCLDMRSASEILQGEA
jgi:hypothetical protein